MGGHHACVIHVIVKQVTIFGNGELSKLSKTPLPGHLDLSMEWNVTQHSEAASVSMSSSIETLKSCREGCTSRYGLILMAAKGWININGSEGEGFQPPRIICLSAERGSHGWQVFHPVVEFGAGSAFVKHGMPSSTHKSRQSCSSACI